MLQLRYNKSQQLGEANLSPMKKELITQAFEQAEKEAQEKEIAKIKQIVQSYLEEIRSKQEQHDNLGKEIKLLKSDLDDLKSGRLDKIEERQRVDEKARDISLIIIKKIEKYYIPYYPWRSPWMIECKSKPSNWATTFTTTNSGGEKLVAYGMGDTWEGVNSTLTLEATGQTFSNFAGGSYQVRGRIVNL